MRAPDFWYRPRDTEAQLLSPLGWVYATVGRVRHAVTIPIKTSVPVICIGNLTVGGTGKTPVAIAVAKALQARGLKVAFLLRGYGAKLLGAMVVDPAQDHATDVGDEALLLARTAMTIASPDRPAGARLAISRGAQVIVMDDGFQNPSLHKDLSFVVVDAARGFGNGAVVPAGPLREPIDEGLARAGAVILMGEGDVPLPLPRPTLRAKLTPHTDDAAAFKGQTVAAMAGIGAPEKFFATLQNVGATLAFSRAFPDHHPFKDDEIAAFLRDAAALNAKPATTEKDMTRIPAQFRDQISTLRVEVEFDTPSRALLNDLLDQCLSTAPSKRKAAQ